MKTTVYVGTSLDGFIAEEDGKIDWLVNFANDEATTSYQEFMNRIDAIVIGRGTFEKVLTFPQWHYKKKVFVLSSTITEIPEMAKEKVSVLAMQPKKLMNYLTGEGFSNIYVDGGKVIQSFLKEDLIDELIISQVPILLGGGIPLFAQLDIRLEFNHIRTEVNSNGLVRSYFERKR